MHTTFLPLLDMEGSFNPADLADIDQLAVLYRKLSGEWTPQFDHFEGVAPPDRELPSYIPGSNGLLFAPQGGLRTTARSLMKLVRLLQHNGHTGNAQLIQPETMAFLLEPQWIFNGSNGDPYFGLYYAFGAGAHHTTNRPNEDVVVPGHFFTGHPGAAYGLASNLYIRTGEGPDTAILFITNGVGTGLGFDARSSFYTIETDVFEAFAHHILAPCMAQTSLNHPPETESAPAASFQLLRPYPNPFNSQTRLSWEMNRPDQVRISVYDTAGRLVRSLASAHYGPGKHHLSFDASALSSGTYIVRFQSKNGLTQTVSITVLK